MEFLHYIVTIVIAVWVALPFTHNPEPPQEALQEPVTVVTEEYAYDFCPDTEEFCIYPPIASPEPAPIVLDASIPLVVVEPIPTQVTATTTAEGPVGSTTTGGPVGSTTTVTVVAPAQVVTTPAPSTYEQAPVTIYIQPTINITPPAPAYVPPPATKPMDEKSEMIVSLYSQGKPDPLPGNNVPFGTWAYKVSVLDAEGKHIKGAEVTMTPGEFGFVGNSKDQFDHASSTTKKTNAVSGWVETPEKKYITDDWYLTFVVTPQEKGEMILVFTSGKFTKEVKLDVQ